MYTPMSRRDRFRAKNHATLNASKTLQRLAGHAKGGPVKQVPENELGNYRVPLRAGWYVMMTNDDGRQMHAANFGMSMSCEAAGLIAGALRDEQTDASVGLGWNYVAKKLR